MDSNDSFSLAMDTPDMPGYVPGLAPGGPHGHGPLPHPHPGLYPDHYDQAGPGLPPHPVFTSCGQFVLIRNCGINSNLPSFSGGMDDSGEYDPPSPDSWIGEGAPYPP